MKRLNLGHFWGVAAVNLAVVGRIWVVARNLLSRHQIIFSHLINISYRKSQIRMGATYPTILKTKRTKKLKPRSKQQKGTKMLT